MEPGAVLERRGLNSSHGVRYGFGAIWSKLLVFEPSWYLARSLQRSRRLRGAPPVRARAGLC